MKILIDNEECPFSAEIASKGQILASVKDSSGKKGRVVCSVAVDGTSMDEDAFLALSGGMEVRFTTRPVRDLVAESLTDAGEYLKKLSSGLTRVAGNLEAKKTTEGFELLGQAAEGVGWLLQIVHNCQALLSVNDAEVGDGALGVLKTMLLEELEKTSRSVEDHKPLELALRIRSGVLPTLHNLGGYIDALLKISGSSVQ